MAEWLVEHGISSLSANIDAVAKIRDRVARTEQRMILEAARRVHAREGV
jgi:pyruvate,water dikinase